MSRFGQSNYYFSAARKDVYKLMVIAFSIEMLKQGLIWKAGEEFGKSNWPLFMDMLSSVTCLRGGFYTKTENNKVTLYSVDATMLLASMTKLYKVFPWTVDSMNSSMNILDLVLMGGLGFIGLTGLMSHTTDKFKEKNTTPLNDETRSTLTLK